MIFEFQRELSNGEWKALGLSRTGSDAFDLDAAAAALQATWDGPLPAGSYRVRSPEGDSRWRYARVGREGEFVLLDQSDPQSAADPSSFGRAQTGTGRLTKPSTRGDTNG